MLLSKRILTKKGHEESKNKIVMSKENQGDKEEEELVSDEIDLITKLVMDSFKNPELTKEKKLRKGKVYHS